MRILLVALTFLFLPSALVAAQTGDPLFDRSFEFRAGDVIDVITSSPDVVIETRSGRNARVRVEGSGPRVQSYFDFLRFSAERSGNRLVIRTNPSGTFTGLGTRNSVRILVTVPDRADIHVRTSSGDITSDRIRGDVHLTSSSGDVRLGDVDGATIEVTTSSGDIRTGNLDGRARVEFTTSSGDVRLGTVRSPRLALRSSSGDLTAGELRVGRFEARAASGDIRIAGVSGPSNLTTGSGDVRLARVGGPVEVRTGSGSVEIHLSEGVPVDARTGSGSFTLHAPRSYHATVDIRGGSVDIAERFRFIGERERRRVRGTLNGGGHLLNVQTGSGTVRILAR